VTHSTNSFAYPSPITLDALDDLFAHHRHRFGGWLMEGDGSGGDAGAGGAGSGAGDDGKEKGYTAPASQADLDRIISDRLAREREKYADYSDLKAKAEAHDAALEAAKSDADKAIDAARAEGETAATTAANARIVKAEAKVLASDAKFRNPSLAIATIDLSDVKVNDDGSIDSDAVKAKLKALAESDPYLVDDGKKLPLKPDRSQGGGGGDAGTQGTARGREMYAASRGKKSS
jgi:hypothetical protein